MNTSTPKLISVCIPTYEMYGLGYVFLKQSFDILTSQTFKDFDIVISDHSKTDAVKNVCDEYLNKLDIKYFEYNNPVVGLSLNTNNTMANATGKLLKILFLDDFLYNDKSLEIIVENFNPLKDKWLATACEHTRDGKTFYKTHLPRNNRNIHLRNNSIGSPSVLTIINEDPLMFDPNLKWLVDRDYYKRLYDKYGDAKIVNEIGVVIRTGDHQITNREITKEVVGRELEYVLKKYNVK